jgi:hypothetical protein
LRAYLAHISGDIVPLGKYFSIFGREKKRNVAFPLAFLNDDLDFLCLIDLVVFVKWTVWVNAYLIQEPRPFVSCSFIQVKYQDFIFFCRYSPPELNCKHLNNLAACLYLIQGAIIIFFITGQIPSTSSSGLHRSSPWAATGKSNSGK